MSFLGGLVAGAASGIAQKAIGGTISTIGKGGGFLGKVGGWLGGTPGTGQVPGTTTGGNGTIWRTPTGSPTMFGNAIQQIAALKIAQKFGSQNTIPNYSAHVAAMRQAGLNPAGAGGAIAQSPIPQPFSSKERVYNAAQKVFSDYNNQMMGQDIDLLAEKSAAPNVETEPPNIDLFEGITNPRDPKQYAYKRLQDKLAEATTFEETQIDAAGEPLPQGVYRPNGANYTVWNTVTGKKLVYDWVAIAETSEELLGDLGSIPDQMSGTLGHTADGIFGDNDYYTEKGQQENLRGRNRGRQPRVPNGTFN